MDVASVPFMPCKRENSTCHSVDTVRQALGHTQQLTPGPWGGGRNKQVNWDVINSNRRKSCQGNRSRSAPAAVLSGDAEKALESVILGALGDAQRD